MESLITTQKSVSDLIGQFQSGTPAIPEIQRDVVWDTEHPLASARPRTFAERLHP